MNRGGPAGSRYPLIEEFLRKVGPHARRKGIHEREDGSAVGLVVFGGRGAQFVMVEEGYSARLALSSPFELYRKVIHFDFLSGIWSQELGTVECEVVAHDEVGRFGLSYEEKDRRARGILAEFGLRDILPMGANPLERRAPFSAEEMAEYQRRLARDEALRRDFEERELDPRVRLFLEADGGAVVSVGPCSDPWVLWRGDRTASWRSEGPERPLVRRCLTLRVEGVELADGQEASEILERFGGAALFELERATGVGLALGYARGRMPRETGTATPSPPLPGRLASRYDREPLSLYWYARSAEEEMPLLSFLAFYQVLEFYFPAYSPSERMQALREKLRELAAREVGEDDVEGVLEATGLNKRRLLPEERKQLMNVLGRCVDPERLEDFLGGDEERERYYKSDESLLISRFGLPPGKGSPNRRKDRRNRVAERIYEIRNRVVHAKADHDELGPLLPFDKETLFLRHDVELVAFLAGEVISASRRPLAGDEIAGSSPEDPLWLA